MPTTITPNQFSPNAGQVGFDVSYKKRVVIDPNYMDGTLLTTASAPTFLPSAFAYPQAEPLPTLPEAGHLKFTTHGYMNFLLKAVDLPPFPHPVSPATFLRISGIIFKDIRTNNPVMADALANLPQWGVSLMDYSYVAQDYHSGIQVYNACLTPSRWKFYIVFQWFDGAISMIDPDIENDPR